MLAEQVAAIAVAAVLATLLPVLPTAGCEWPEGTVYGQRGSDIGVFGEWGQPVCQMPAVQGFIVRAAWDLVSRADKREEEFGRQRDMMMR